MGGDALHHEVSCLRGGDIAVVGRCCKGMLHHEMGTLWEEKSWETLLSDITVGDIVLQNGIIAGENFNGRRCRGRHCTMRWQQFGGDIAGSAERDVAP